MRDKLHDLIFDGMVKCVEAGELSVHVDAEAFADYLIANGVTFADVPDNNVGDKWIPISERPPDPFVSVLVQMPGEEPCPTVREGYLTNNGTWYAGHFEREPSEVTHWMPMPEFHSKEERNVS
jgi:hypothetical protein